MLTVSAHPKDQNWDHGQRISFETPYEADGTTLKSDIASYTITAVDEYDPGTGTVIVLHFESDKVPDHFETVTLINAAGAAESAGTGLWRHIGSIHEGAVLQWSEDQGKWVNTDALLVVNDVEARLGRLIDDVEGLSDVDDVRAAGSALGAGDVSDGYNTGISINLVNGVVSTGSGGTIRVGSGLVATAHGTTSADLDFDYTQNTALNTEIGKIATNASAIEALQNNASGVDDLNLAAAGNGVILKVEDGDTASGTGVTLDYDTRSGLTADTSVAGKATTDFDYIGNDDLHHELIATNDKILHIYDQFTGAENVYVDSANYESIFAARTSRYGNSNEGSNINRYSYWNERGREFKVFFHYHKTNGNNPANIGYAAARIGDRIGVGLSVAAFDESNAPAYTNVFNFRLTARGRFGASDTDGTNFDVYYMSFNLEDASRSLAFGQALDASALISDTDISGYTYITNSSSFWTTADLVRKHQNETNFVLSANETALIDDMVSEVVAANTGNILQIAGDQALTAIDPQILQVFQSGSLYQARCMLHTRFGVLYLLVMFIDLT